MLTSRGEHGPVIREKLYHFVGCKRNWASSLRLSIELLEDNHRKVLGIMRRKRLLCKER